MARRYRSSELLELRGSPAVLQASSASDAAANASRSTFAVRSLPLVARVHDRERHLERDEHDERQREIAREQPPAHATQAEADPAHGLDQRRVAELAA